jgi:hypothetical protein
LFSNSSSVNAIVAAVNIDLNILSPSHFVASITEATVVAAAPAP